MGYLTYLGSHTFMSCSQTIYFLLKVRRARVIKKTAGDLLTASARGSLARSPMFPRRTKTKIKRRLCTG